MRALDDEDLLALPILYRGALSSLSVARETSLDLELITYLEGLCARAYFFVYGVRTSAGSRIGAFFARDWPRGDAGPVARDPGLAGDHDRSARSPAICSSPATPTGTTASSRRASPTAAISAPRTEFLRGTLYDNPGADGLSRLRDVPVHPQQPDRDHVLRFGLRLRRADRDAADRRTARCSGAILALYVSRGLGLEMGGWLIIHGSTEMFAIILAGAAGFRIGWSVVFPGEETRLDAATRAGRTSALVMAGVVAMLACAGLLEGIGRQIDHRRRGPLRDRPRPCSRLWLAYFYLPRRADV